MLIKEISTHIVHVPLGDSRFYSSQAAFPARNSLLVRILTDDGLVGWGEGGQYGPPSPVAAVIDDVFAPQLVGRSITGPTAIWEELYAFSRDFGQKGTYVEALSAIDIALWDLWGQSLGQPIHALMGGAVRHEVVAYATGCYYTDRHADHRSMLDALHAEAETYAAAGFRTLKMKIGLLSHTQDGHRVAAVRAAIGPEHNLLVDANHAYNAAGAIRMGRVLEEHGVGWFEEPVVPEDHAGYRAVRQALDVPVAGGEAEFTRFGFRDVVATGCVDIIQPDVCVTGGLSEYAKLLALASAWNVQVIPHVWGSGIALAAGLHAVAITPASPWTYAPVPLQNEPVIEYDRKHNPLRDELLVENFELRDGKLAVPSGPGLGIEVDPTVLRRYEATA